MKLINNNKNKLNSKINWHRVIMRTLDHKNRNQSCKHKLFCPHPWYMGSEQRYNFMHDFMLSRIVTAFLLHTSTLTHTV